MLTAETIENPKVTSMAGHQNRKTTKSVEYYTPGWLVEAARETMGSIEMDPASSEKANTIVKADFYYSLADGDNGLKAAWSIPYDPWGNVPANVFLNYPSEARKWWLKLLEERGSGRVKQAIVVAYSADPVFALQYGCGLAMTDFPVCLLSKRVAYLTEREDGSLKAKAGTPCHSAVVYLPGIEDNTDRFYAAFRQYGQIVTPLRAAHFKPITP